MLDVIEVVVKLDVHIVESGDSGALLLTEEAFDDPACSRLTSLLDAQPSWSDIPVLLFVGSSGADLTSRTPPVSDMRRS